MEYYYRDIKFLIEQIIIIKDEKYPEDKQQALMCILPKEESITKSAEEKVI